jgi:CDP-diglyceride synthetase
MEKVWALLYTLAPIALGGILNMVWVRLPILSSLKIPIDGGRLYRDGKRLFGDNKTWKGFVGMPLLTAMTTLMFSKVSELASWSQNLSLIPYETLPFAYPYVTLGFIWGLAYVLAELPNSFIKRRLNIGAGKNASGILGATFLVIDQADSVLGCVLVTLLFYRLSVVDGLGLIVLATGVHLLINTSLFVVGLKKQFA